MRDVSGRGRPWAVAAAGLALLYAAVSAYWGAGGHALLDTLGGLLEREARGGGSGILLVVWVTVVVKVLVGALGIAAVTWAERVRGANGWRRWLRPCAWLAAGILVLYGGVLSISGWLVQTGVVHRAAHADERALRWHAYLWDPWFLVWGVLLTVALARSRSATRRERVDLSGDRVGEGAGS